MHMAANARAKPAFNKNTVAPAPWPNARSPIETPSDPRTPDAGSLSLADAGALSAEINPITRVILLQVRNDLGFEDANGGLSRIANVPGPSARH